jgi:DNA-binding NarL/FixJ family response regulator
VTSILIADSNAAQAAALANVLLRPHRRTRDADTWDQVETVTDFSAARTKLEHEPPALLVTALQLGAYNGLHLVYLGAALQLPTKSVVHTDTFDPAQAREVRTAGAFYEVRSRLASVLPAYASAVLPPRDRRETLGFDRRQYPRGGRRVADQQPSL